MQTSGLKIEKPAERPAHQFDHRAILIAGVLAVVTLLIYLPVRNYDFVDFDDSDYLSKNPPVQQGVTLMALKWAFTTGHGSNWFPLTWFSHMLDVQFYGLHHPGGHHFTSLLFHLANTLLLFQLWRRLTGALWRSALIAALFAWHPLHVESVAWVAERKDVLSAFFFLLTLVAYTRFIRESSSLSFWKKTSYWLTLVVFALALMSKPMAVTLPFVLLLLDFWPLNRVTFFKNASSAPAQTVPQTTAIALLVEKIPFFVLCAASSFTTFLVQGKAMDTYVRFPQRFRNALANYGWYLLKNFWPSKLAVFYPLRLSVPIANVFCGSVLLILISAVALGWAKSRPWLLTGWFWFAGMLVPVIGLVQVGSQSTADRYSYLPSVGLFVIVVWGGNELLNHAGKFKNPLAIAVMVPLLAACIATCSRQVSHWKNSETLFRHAVEVTTNNALAHMNLGRALDDAGRTEEARAEFFTAMQGGQTPRTLVTLGTYYAGKGNDLDAIKYYRQAIAENSFYMDAHYNLGNVLAREGKLEEAVSEYSEALRISPDAPDAHNNLGAVLLHLGRLDGAEAEFKTALRLQPGLVTAEDQLGHVLLKLGHSDLALAHFREAVKLSPDLADAQLQFGVLLAQRGELSQALDPLRAAVELEPRNFQAVFTLAALYEALQKFDLAAEYFTQAKRLKPNDANTAARLAGVLAKQGK